MHNRVKGGLSLCQRQHQIRCNALKLVLSSQTAQKAMPTASAPQDSVHPETAKASEGAATTKGRPHEQLYLAGLYKNDVATAQGRHGQIFVQSAHGCAQQEQTQQVTTGRPRVTVPRAISAGLWPSRSNSKDMHVHGGGKRQRIP